MAEPTSQPPGVDIARIADAVREILLAVGEDPDRDGLRRTPQRVAEMYRELLGGLHDDPAGHLTAIQTDRYDGIVMVRDIRFNSMCEHHLLPFEGVAHVAYQPAGKVLGISSLARVVDAFARRPQVQERLTSQIADAIMSATGARGAAVVMEATHTCMTCRGVRKRDTRVVTSVMRGECRSDPGVRAEVVALLGAARPTRTDEAGEGH